MTLYCLCIQDLPTKYLREINDYKQHKTILEQKLVKFEEESDALQLAARLIAEDTVNIAEMSIVIP